MLKIPIILTEECAVNSGTVKNLIISLSIILAMTAGFGSDSRILRWEKRIDRLEKLEKNIDPAKYLPSVAEILREGIRSSGEVADILGRYSSGDGSLKSGTKKFHVSDIEERARTIALPVIAYTYLLDTMKLVSDSDTQSMVLDQISSYAVSRGMQVIKLNSPLGSGLARGYIMELRMNAYRDFEDSCYRKVLGAAELELSKTDYNSSEQDVEKIIIDAALVQSELMIKDCPVTFSAKYLEGVAEWRILEERMNVSADRNNAAETFALSRNIPAEDSHGRGIEYIDRLVFTKERRAIEEMIENSTSSVSSGSSNPVYEIPDFKQLLNAIDDLDRYRESLIKRIDGTENSSFCEKVRENNNAIIEKYIARYEALYRREEARIAGIKKSSPGVIIYNEEIFAVSRNHFNEIKSMVRDYAALSSLYVERVSGRSKEAVPAFMSNMRFMAERRIEYISFVERLTKDTDSRAVTGSEKLNGIYKRGIKHAIEFVRDSIGPLTVPPEIRKNMTKDDIRELASINESLKKGGSVMADSIRKNFQNFSTASRKAIEDEKRSAAESESSIAQQETGALFNFARRCSDELALMKNTDAFLKQYNELYETIAEDIRQNGTASRYADAVNSGSIIQLVTACKPEDVEREALSREILAKEGFDSLSSAVSLYQYYSRRGTKVQYVPAEKDLAELKKCFAYAPSVKAGSWVMTGKNFRQVDRKCTETLKQMLSKSSWNQNNKNAGTAEGLKLSCPGLDIAFTNPGNWSDSRIDCEAGSGIRLENSDGTGWIEVYAIPVEPEALADFSSDWSGKRGFSMVEKSWGKIRDADFFRTLCKDRRNHVADTRMFKKNGYVIIVCGVAPKEKSKNMSAILEKLFKGLSF